MRQPIETALKQTINNISSLYNNKDKDYLEVFCTNVSRLDIFTMLSSTTIIKLDNLLYSDGQDVIFEFITMFNTNLTLQGITKLDLLNIIKDNIEIVNSTSLSNDLRKVVLEKETTETIENNRLLILLYILRLFIVETMVFIKGSK